MVTCPCSKHSENFVPQCALYRFAIQASFRKEIVISSSTLMIFDEEAKGQLSVGGMSQAEWFKAARRSIPNDSARQGS